MSIIPIYIGQEPNDGKGQNLRSGGLVINNNFSELDTRTTAAQSAADKAHAKLAGIDQGATKNRPDAELLNRTNHTGMQLASTISDLANAIAVKVAEWGGGADKAPVIADCNTVTRGGLYSVTPTTLNQPATGSFTLLHEPHEASGTYTQIAIGTGAGSALYVRSNAGAWTRVLKVGDYGVGSASPQLVSDANITTVPGYYRVDPKTTGTPFPMYGMLETRAYDVGNISQILITTRGHPQGELMYYRTYGGGTWSKWEQIMKVGDFGIGSKGEQVLTITDANILMPSGKYRVYPETANGPGVYGTLEWSYYDPTNWTQLVLATTNLGTYKRSCINGAIQPWINIDGEVVSNANGMATKLPDGTMVCYCNNKPSGAATNQPAPGSGIFFDNGIAFTWPVPFVGTPPKVSVVSEPRTVFFGLAGLNAAPTLIGVSDVRFVSFASGASGNINAIAIGRWK